MNKKILLSLLGVTILIIGVIAGVFLLRRNQNIKKKASSPGGTATVSLNPQNGQFNVGDDFSVTVSFNPQGQLISAIAVRLSYTFEGSDVELSAQTPQISQTLLSSGNWTCPIKEVDIGNSIVNIDISCINTSTTGFTSSSDILLATIPFTAEEETSSPVSLEFDSIQSIVTQKSDASDVLLTPTSSGSYSVVSSADSKISESPTPTPTATTTVTSSSSPTPTPTNSNSDSTVSTTPTPTPTAPADLPQSGVTLPTIIALATATVLLGLSLAVII